MGFARFSLRFFRPQRMRFRHQVSGEARDDVRLSEVARETQHAMDDEAMSDSHSSAVSGEHGLDRFINRGTPLLREPGMPVVLQHLLERCE